MRELVRRSPLAAYFAISFTFTWALLPWAARSIAVSLVALIGPAVAAVAVTSILGSAEVTALRRRVFD